MSRRIWLCADDYGISPGVNRAIRDLIENGRLNATSAMVVGPAIGRDDVNALKAAAEANPRCAIGLHVTLTAPFRPLTMHFRPIEGGLFLPHTKLLRRGLTGRFDSELIHTEVTVQLATFADLFGRPPDFVDDHPVRAAQDFEALRRDLPQQPYRQPRPWKRLFHKYLLRQSQLSSNPPHLILEQIPQRLDQRERHIRR